MKGAYMQPLRSQGFYASNINIGSPLTEEAKVERAGPEDTQLTDRKDIKAFLNETLRAVLRVEQHESFSKEKYFVWDEDQWEMFSARLKEKLCEQAAEKLLRHFGELPMKESNHELYLESVDIMEAILMDVIPLKESANLMNRNEWRQESKEAFVSRLEREGVSVIEKGKILKKIETFAVINRV